MKALIKIVIIALIALEPIAFVILFAADGSLLKLAAAAFAVGAYAIARKLYREHLSEA